MTEHAPEEWLQYIQSTNDALQDMLERLAKEPPPKSEEYPRALWCWVLFFGSLAFDVTQSALALLQVGHERAPTMLLRSVFEYAVRLRYYAVNEQDAIDALKRAEAKMYLARKDTVGEPYLKQLDADYRSKMDAMIADPMMLVQRKFGFMRNTAVPGDGPAQASMFVANYEQPSYFIHGDERLLEDVIADAEGDEPTWLGATPPHVIAPDWICQHIAYQILEVMNSVEWALSKTTDETRSHFEALNAIADRFGTRHKAPDGTNAP